MFDTVQPTAAEVASPMPGDAIVAHADVVMDRAFTLPGRPADVFPWFAQLGRRRAGWYLPRRVERLLPPRSRALRHLEPRLLDLAVGDVISDWPGRDDTFELAQLEPPHVLVHRSVRRGVAVSWAITLHGLEADATRTRVRLRLRLGPVKRRRLAETAGGFVDLLTVAGLAAGLRERLR